MHKVNNYALIVQKVMYKMYNRQNFLCKFCSQHYIGCIGLNSRLNQHCHHNLERIRGHKQYNYTNLDLYILCNYLYNQYRYCQLFPSIDLPCIHLSYSKCLQSFYYIHNCNFCNLISFYIPNSFQFHISHTYLLLALNSSHLYIWSKNLNRIVCNTLGKIGKYHQQNKTLRYTENNSLIKANCSSHKQGSTNCKN